MVLAVLVMGGGYLWLRSWLHSGEFREMLAAEAGKAMEVDADFGPFRWDGTQMATESFDARGDGLVRSIEARGLELDIGLGKARRGIVELREGRINQLAVAIDVADGGADPGSAPLAVEPAPCSDVAPVSGGEAWYHRFLPDEVRLEGLEIGHSSLRVGLDAGELDFSGTRWSIEPEETRGAYRALARDGRIAFPWERVPEMDLLDARLVYRDGTIFLTEAQLGLYRRGRLRLVGEASLEGGPFSFDGELRDVGAHEILPEDWRQRIEGGVEGEFGISNRRGGVTVNGTTRLLNGVLTGLPVLDALGAYGGNPRFRRLALNEAEVDFSWEDGVLRLTRIALASEGLMQLTGTLTVDREERLDGRFRLGLTPGTLAIIPGAETKVFLPGERGLLWAPVRITGTLDDPREDLSNRLIAAAGMRMFEVVPETGERVLKYTDRVVSEESIERGRRVLEGGDRVIEMGRGLLDGEGDLVDEAERLLREGGGVAEEVDGLFDILRGGEEPPREPE